MSISAMILMLCVFVSVIPIRSNGILEASGPTELQRLQDDLLKDYDGDARPVIDGAQGISVQVFFDVQHLVSMDEKDQILTVKGVLMMKWKDQFLKWDPSKYSGISAFRIAPKLIWQPNIQNLHNLKSDHIDNSTPITAYSNGTCKWYPPVLYQVPCSAEYRYYPFDTHSCSIKFVSWTYVGNEVSLETINLPILPEDGAAGAEWSLAEVTHRTQPLHEKDDSMKAVVTSLVLRRRSSIQRYVTVVPTILSFVTALFGFWLLPGSPNRLMIGCTNIIIMTLLLQHITLQVPSGKNIPLLAQYCAACLCMSGVFLLSTSIGSIVQQCSGQPPSVLLGLARGSWDRYLCLSAMDYSTEVTLPDLKEENARICASSLEEEKRRKDWKLVALLIDRIIFYIFAFVITVLLIVLATI